jgi:hypothetical protein
MPILIGNPRVEHQVSDKDIDCELHSTKGHEVYGRQNLGNASKKRENACDRMTAVLIELPIEVIGLVADITE